MDAECRRRAWLVLPKTGARVALEDTDQGWWACTELDIQYPSVRDAVSNRPDAYGTDDRTSLWGSRVVTASITARTDVFTADDIARKFAPFMVPGLRPELHWTLDTPLEDYRERVITLRATDMSSPIKGGNTRAVSLGWVAPDPLVYDATGQLWVIRPEWGGGTGGRTYNLTFDRVYPQNGGGQRVTAPVIPRGDTDVAPLIRCFGPLGQPQFYYYWSVPGGPTVSAWWAFLPGFNIDPNRYVDLDMAARTVTADDGTRLEGQVDWFFSQWFVFPAGSSGVIGVTGQSANQVSLAQVSWRDAWVEP